MKLSTVLSAVNENPNYYNFIPKQILFWNKFNIKFIAVYVGKSLPDELLPYSDNIILWSRNHNLNTAFVAQNIRIYYPSLIKVPDDEMVMITDMDMLPMSDDYYKNDMEKYNINDFIYYRHIDGDQIYIMYNATHPKTWGRVFNISSEEDIEEALNNTYKSGYSGVPGSHGWWIDQKLLYKKLIGYKNLKVLNRPIKRLGNKLYRTLLKKGETDFAKNYDDAHFHRSYSDNLDLILDAEKQLGITELA